MKDDLDKIEQAGSLKFKLAYTIDELKDSSVNWTGDKGYVTEEMIKKYIPEPSDETLVLVCGPPAMTKKLLQPLLKKIGYSEDNINLLNPFSWDL